MFLPKIVCIQEQFHQNVFHYNFYSTRACADNPTMVYNLAPSYTVSYCVCTSGRFAVRSEFNKGVNPTDIVNVGMGVLERGLESIHCSNLTPCYRRLKWLHKLACRIEL